ncbi:NBS-LRR type resistance protein [Cucumis melo var. makuwa]|uniref:NBS-LRR type resistance protein n=1 Tax=Cucumis melo var. makuwa TaxID=1194695 RepID=A0A5A7TPJ5_CUCMM|nr:NBS-LRR type resistance protein [Cucumis melo var. makuwa]TYK02665.1 NBS-LRR type resistance protein [Cucumis melo var. makuwa]
MLLDRSSLTIIASSQSRFYNDNMSSLSKEGSRSTVWSYFGKHTFETGHSCHRLRRTSFSCLAVLSTANPNSTRKLSVSGDLTFLRDAHLISLKSQFFNRLTLLSSREATNIYFRPCEARRKYIERPPTQMKKGFTRRIGGGGPKKKPVSRSVKAGVQFPVGKICRYLKNG